MSPLISIITPNYNCARFIAQTIKSVLAQTYTNWELLIVDDCSTDGSYEIALKYAQKDSRIKVFRNEKNSGAAISRNRAIEESKGEYLAFLDSDDLWLPEKLQVQLNFMRNSSADFSYTRYRLIDEEGVFSGRVARIPNVLSYSRLKCHDFIGCLTVMYRAEPFKEIRSFDVKNNNDYGLFLQIVRKSQKAFGLQKVLAEYRIRKGGISRNKMKKIPQYFRLMHGFLHIPYIICCVYLCANVLIGKIWKYESRDKYIHRIMGGGKYLVRFSFSRSYKINNLLIVRRCFCALLFFKQNDRNSVFLCRKNMRLKIKEYFDEPKRDARCMA